MTNFYIGDCRKQEKIWDIVRMAGSLLMLAALFLAMFVIYGPGVYNDSDQYIKMHIHREPLYPLFLLILRTLFGAGWLTAMGVIQNLLAAVSIWLFARCVAEIFRLKFWQELVIIAFCLLPHVMTMYFSSLHLFMTNSVMSEAICLPLFTLFVMECLRMITGKRKRDIWIGLSLALLLSLTRNQMMLAILMWAVVLGARVIKEKKRILPGFLAVLFLTGAAFGVKSLAVRSYNLVFNDHFIANTYGPVNTLTNILYASDREDGERIEDPQARAFFYQMYDLMEETKTGYRYGGNTIGEKARHIEQWHDTIKYRMIEDVFYQTYDQTVTSDYITQNLMADETAGKIIAGVLPACFGRWFLHYLILAGYGLIRSIAVVHPLINIAAIGIYFFAFVLMAVVARMFRKREGKTADAVWFMGIGFLGVFANAFAVSITIMALSRYMIYGFAPFYCGLFCLTVSWCRLIKERKN